EIGHLLARLLHRFFGGPPERMVPAGSVAEFAGEVRQHRLDDARVHRRRRVIVHVDRELDRHMSFYKRVCNTAVFVAVGGGISAASSAIVHSPSAARIRSRTRHSGSRTLHFANCSHCPSSVEQAVTVTGPSMAWITAVPEI